MNIFYNILRGDVFVGDYEDEHQDAMKSNILYMINFIFMLDPE